MSIDNLAEYGRTGTAADFVNDIVTNMNSIGSGWTAGTVDPETETKTIVFSNENCWKALMKVAEAFALEWTLTGKSISMVKSVGTETLLSFEYGRNVGLNKLERVQVQDQNIVTKVYGFGSMTNIPDTYRNRAKRLVFEETSAPSGYGGGIRFLTKNTELYGVIEGQFTDDDIFPNRTGTVEQAVQLFDTNNLYLPGTSYIQDGTIDFNIIDYYINGMTPLIVFKSGALGGQEFEIWKYDPDNKRIYFNPQSDEDGWTTPQPGFVAAPGDTYTLVNIALPQAYIDTAEAALLAATEKYLDENSVPMVAYIIDLDPKYAKTNTIVVAVGDKVTVIDSALGVNSLIRISELSYPLINPYKKKAVIADFVPYTTQERIIHAAISSTIETRIVDRSADELTRRNAMRQRQLLGLIFDADGYFDGSRIKPLTVETMALAVGAKSQNFHLNGVTIKANYLGNPNSFYVSPGELVHHEIDISGQYVWEIQAAYEVDNLTPTTAYYLYAKCSKLAMVGEWLLSDTQYAADGIDGYYYFLCGILYAVYTDDIGSWRDFDFTYGMTYINGRTITTGRIQTLNKLNYIDLDTNMFRIGDSNSSLDWGVTVAGQLTLKGVLVQRGAGEYFPVILFRGVYNPAIVYYHGDMVTYNNQTWMFHNDTPTAGVTPVEGEFWTLTSQVGAQGADGASPIGIYRGEWSIGTDYYGTSIRVDIVHYGGVYYIAKPTAGNPFRGIVPTNTAFWQSFGANFESIATKLIFAEFAFIDNLGVRFFEGIPVSPGDLDGYVTNTLPNIAGTARIDHVVLTYGISGSANITCNGVTRLCNFASSLSQSAQNFKDLFYTDYYVSGVLLSVSSNILSFTEMNGVDFSGSTSIVNVSGTLSGESNTSPSHVDGQAQVDTVTLTGTGGCADITANGLTRRAYFIDSLSDAAINFRDACDTAYLERDIIVTASGPDIIFTSRYKGQAFTGTTSIVHVDSSYQGAVSIAGNDIWENYTNNDHYGAILINMRGYNGGSEYFRTVVIGDGKGNFVMTIGGNPLERGNHKFININAETIRLWNLPTGGSQCYSGELYVDANGFIKQKLPNRF
jgi:hypothetical protein